MMARRGEVQAVKAANRAGVPFTLSTVGICSHEEVAAASSAPFWFQLYMMHDRELVKRLLEQAWSSGCETLVFTVDLAVTGARHRDLRNGMVGHTFAARLARAGQLARRPRWLFDVALRGRPHSFGNLRTELHDATDLTSYKAFIQSEFDASVTWQDIAWLRTQWAGKIIIKGIMSADDARAAADVGADGLIVSNHGGRQLDGSSSTIRKLPEVAAAVGQRVEVYLDGGVRSGIDVVKAVALGARGVLIGRPWIWAVAARGESGLVDLLKVFRKEIAVAMALMGVTTIAELGPGLVEWREGC
jgi:L-lactate dehydrogenase (cytochrome)